MLLYNVGYTSISRPFVTGRLFLPLQGSHRPKRWRGRHAHPWGVAEYIKSINVMIVDNDVWTQYADQRVHHEFDDTSLFSNYLRWEILVDRHSPKRCLRQFGHVQDIPWPVPAIPFKDIDSWFFGHVLGSACAIMNRAVGVQFPTYCVDGYLEWWLIVSHPHIIPRRKYVDDVELSHAGHFDVGGPSHDVPSPPPSPHGAKDTHRLQMISVLMNNLMGLVNPEVRFILFHWCMMNITQHLTNNYIT